MSGNSPSEIQCVEGRNPRTTDGMVDEPALLQVESQRPKAGEKLSLVFHDRQLLLKSDYAQKNPDNDHLCAKKDDSPKETSSAEGHTDSVVHGVHVPGKLLHEQKPEKKSNNYHEENVSVSITLSHPVEQRLSGGTSGEESSCLEGGSPCSSDNQDAGRFNSLQQRHGENLKGSLLISGDSAPAKDNQRDRRVDTKMALDSFSIMRSNEADGPVCHGGLKEELCTVHNPTNLSNGIAFEHQNLANLEQQNICTSSTSMDNDNQGGVLGPVEDECLEPDHTVAVWVKWRGKWQTSIVCPRVDCPLSTLRAKPAHDKKRYIPCFFPRTKMYSWTEMQLVQSIDKSPEPLAYGTHHRWREMVKDLAFPRLYIMQKLAVAMLNITDQLHTEAVTENARKVIAWKEFAMEASQCKDYSDLGRMLLKLQTMILPRYISCEWLGNSFESWKKSCENAQSAESIELLTEELMDSVLWLEVDELWNASIQSEMDPEWKTWKQEAMGWFSTSQPTSAPLDMEQEDCTDLDAGDQTSRKRAKLEVRRADACVSKVQAPTCMNSSMSESVETSLCKLDSHGHQGSLASCHSLKVDSSEVLVIEPDNLVSGCNPIIVEHGNLQYSPMVVDMEAKMERNIEATTDSLVQLDSTKKYRKCSAFVPTKGRQCERWANDGEIYCCVHLNAQSVEKLYQEEQNPNVEAPMCEGTTTHGRKCKHRARYGSTYCKKHDLQRNGFLRSDSFMSSSWNALMSHNSQNHASEQTSSLNITSDLCALRELQPAEENLVSVVIAETLDERNCLMNESDFYKALPILKMAPEMPRCIGHYNQNNTGEQCPEYAKRHTLYCDNHLPKFLKRARNGKSRLISKEIFIDLLKSCTSRKQKLYLHQACELLYEFMKNGLSHQKVVSRNDIMAWIVSESTKDQILGEFLLKLVSSEREKISRVWSFDPENSKSVSAFETKVISTSMMNKNEHTDLTLKCRICSQDFTNDHILGLHWAQVHKKEARWLFRGYACAVCMNSFTNRKVLETHVRENHGVQFLEHSIIFKCISCSSHFMSHEQLWQHVLSSHINDFRLPETSQQPLDQATDMKMQTSSKVCPNSDTTDMVDDSQKLTCRFCGLKFKLLSDLGRHHQVAHTNLNSISQFLPKRRNHHLRRGRHSYPRFKKSFVAPFRFKSQTNYCIQKHFKSSNIQPPVEELPNQMPESSGLGRLLDSHCLQVAESLFSKIQKINPRPSNDDILSFARSACCRVNLHTTLELKYGKLPDNVYLRALKLCSELNIQVDWHLEGFVCPKGCKPLFSLHYLAPLKPLNDGFVENQASRTCFNIANWEMDESHYVLDQKHLSCKPKVKTITLCQDVSFGREPVPVVCVVDEDLMESLRVPSDEMSSCQKFGTSTPWQGFNYVTERLIESSLVSDTKNSLLGCACQSQQCCPGICDHVYLFDNDNEDAMDVFGNSMRGRFAYNERGQIILEEGSLVYECNSLCKCSMTCQNRVLQKGIHVKLEIFKTEKKGWAVRAGEDIPRGTFVCEYIGEVLSNEEANRRGRRYDSGFCSYLYDIDAHIDTSRGFNEGTVPYVIDATEYGNVSRFINHSCSPNLITYMVLVESMDLQLAHIGLYASQDIATGEELAYDYRYKLLPGDGHPCHCGAPVCRGRLY